MVGAIASRGHEVVGVDVNLHFVDQVNSGRAPVEEPGLTDLMREHKHRISGTMNLSEAVERTDVTFVVVPTPSLPDGSFSTDFALRAFADLGHALASKRGYHLVVLTSTVLPRATRDILIPAIEKSSGKQAGRDFGVCYSPEFIALGSVINDYLNPDFILIGEHDAKAGAMLEETYRQIVTNDAPCRRMPLESAELAKIALNAYVTMKITFANVISDICEWLPNGDVDTVTRAIGLDRRVGSHYLRGGLGFGGPCFPRDNAAIATVARIAGAADDLFQVTDAVNRARPQRIIDRLDDILGPGRSVAVLGISYKPKSSVIEESQGLQLALLAAETGSTVTVFDPAVPPSALASFEEIRVTSSLDECVRGADIVIVANDDDAFRTLPALSPDAVVVDCWRARSRTDGGQLRHVGRHSDVDHARSAQHRRTNEFLSSTTAIA